MRRVMVVLLAVVLSLLLAVPAFAGAPTLVKLTPTGASYSVAGSTFSASVIATFAGGTTSMGYKIGAGSLVTTHASVTSGQAVTVVISGLPGGVSVVTIEATNDDGGTITTADVTYNVTATTLATDDLDTGFAADQVFPTANEFIGKLLPVLYVVLGITVGAWVIRKIRRTF